MRLTLHETLSEIGDQIFSAVRRFGLNFTMKSHVLGSVSSKPSAVRYGEENA